MVRFSLFPTAIGDCGIAWRDDVVVATYLPEKTAAETAAYAATHAGGTEGEPSPTIRSAVEAITALLEGEKTDLTHIPCDFSSVQPIAAKVYAITRVIPAVETLTYGDIALQLGDKHLAQSVGRALGRNPLPIIVPCHRVVGASGKLTGFSAYGGVETKRRMLAIEGALSGETLDLFSD